MVAKLANNCQYRSNTIVVGESIYSDLARTSGMEQDTVHLESPQELILIFPNPAMEIVQINFGAFNAEGIEFFDSSNKSVYRAAWSYPVSSIQADVSGWIPGVYLVSIWSNEKRTWRKLLKY